MPREEYRKRNHQNKAAEEVVDNGADEATAEKVEINSRAAFISCKECGHKATTEKGLKQHKPSGHPPYKHQTSSRQPMTKFINDPLTDSDICYEMLKHLMIYFHKFNYPDKGSDPPKTSKCPFELGQIFFE